MLVDPSIDSMISLAAEIVPQSLLKFHLRQEKLLNLKLRQMAPIRKNGKYFGEGVIVSSFLLPTEKNLIFLPDFYSRMGLQNDAHLQGLTTSIPVKKLRILSRRYKSPSYEQETQTY